MRHPGHRSAFSGGTDSPVTQSIFGSRRRFRRPLKSDRVRRAVDTRLRLIHVDELQVAVWLCTTKDPPPAEWAEACATLTGSIRAANDGVSTLRIFVVSDGGSPNSAQRAALYHDALRDHPVPTAVVSRAMRNPVRRAMAVAMNLLKPRYRVFEPRDVLLAVDHIGLAPSKLDAIWMALRILQTRLPPVAALRLIADDQHLPFEPLRSSQIPPSYRPPPE